MSDPNNIENMIYINGLKNGEQEEFNKLVEIYSDVMYRLIIKIVKNNEDAEDLLQEVFIKISKNIDQFEGRSKLSTWIYKVAINEALMLLRKKKNYEISLDSNNEREDSWKTEEVKKIRDWCCIPEKELLNTESKKYLQEAIKKLSLNLRLVFVLRDINGLSIRDTAETLDVSESVVKTRLFRARNILRQELNEYFSKVV